MIAEVRARDLIEQAVVDVQPPLLVDAFEIVKQLNEPATPFEPATMQVLPSPELLVLIAEAALDLSHPVRTEDDAIAHRVRTQELGDTALQMFLGTDPVPNQFLARAYVAQAEIASRLSTGRKGDGLTDAVLKSMDYVMRALALAQASADRYKFLIYNVSVAYWRCSRPLQRKGYFKHVLPSMPQVFDAVKGLPEEDAEWKAMFASVLARAFIAEEQQGRAVEVLNVVSGLTLSDKLHIQIMRLLVHASSGGQGAAMASTPRHQLHIDVQKVRSGLSPADEATLMGLLENEAMREDARLHSEIGRIALMNNLPAVADTAAKAIESNKDAGMSAVVLAECTRAELNVLGLGEEANLFTKRMVDARVDALQKLDKALITATRAKDAEVVHEVCALAWALGLPLLQPNLRRQAKRTLQSCVKALEDMRSPLHELRAQLHLEVARCDIADDLYAAAALQVQRGLGMDYCVAQERVVEYKRPFDLHLNLLHKKLSMKMSLYAAPERAEDKAMLVIEQAREAHDGSLKTSLLERAAGMLAKVSPAADRPQDEVPIPELNEGVDVAYSEAGVRKERALLWADIALIAWQALNPKITLEAAEEAVALEADRVKDKALCIAQAQVYFARSEALFMKLKQAGLEPGRPLPDVAANPKNNTALAAWAVDTRTKIVSGFVAGMRLGRDVQEDWLCLNAAAYLWNYHLPLFKQGQLDDVYAALEETVATLLLCKARDAALFASLADGLARALEQRHASGQEAAYPPEGLPDAPPLGDASCLGHGQAVCKAAVSEYDEAKMTPMTSKRPAATLARLQFLASGTSGGVVPEGSEETQLVMMLEAMRLDGDGKADWVDKAMDLLPSCPNNPELFALLGQEAYSCGRFPACMLACKRAVAMVGKIGRPLPRLWRWFALAELFHGRALFAQIDPDKHDMASQDHLKRQAIAHFVQAAKYASQVPSDNLMSVAAECMWNASTGFMSSAAARQSVLEPLQALVHLLTKVKVTEESDEGFKALRTKLYVVLCEALADAQRWGDGLDVTGKALKVLPPSCHRDLWDFRMMFLGKLGKDTTAEMLKVKESGEDMVARVWTVLAQSMSDKKAKLQAYYKAVEVLEHKPLAQAEYLVLYGEFLYSEGFAIHDAQDQLIAAADALLELDTALADEEEASSRVSGSQSDSRSQSSAASSYFQPPSSAKGKSPRAGTAKSAGAKSAASRSSRAASSTVASTAGGGAGGKPPALNVGHLQELGRIYVMLATMGKERKEVADSLLVAQHYLTRMLAMSVKCINEQLASQAAAAAEGEAPSAQAVELPADLQGWIGFELSDETCALFMADRGKDKLVLNKRTCKKPYLLLYYLDLCITGLLDNDLELPCLPVLRLYIFVAKYVIKSEDLEVMGRLREAVLYQRLALTAEADKVHQRIGSFTLSKEKQRLLSELVRQRESQAAARPASVQGSRARKGGLDGTRPAEGDEIGGAGGKRGDYVKVLRPTSGHEIWVRQGELKLEEGDLATARSLLQRALLHSRAFEDHETEAMALHLLARLAFLQGQSAQAIQLEQDAQAFTNQVDFWCKSCVSMADYVYEESLTKVGGSSADDALKALDKADDIFAMALRDEPNLDFKISRLRARLKLKYGHICVMEAQRQSSLGSVMWKKMHQGGLGAAREAARVMERIGGGPLLVEALAMQARLESEPPSAEPAERQEQLSAALLSLEAAEAAAIECSRMARPANPRQDLRLAANERLATIKLAQARALADLAHEERFHPWALKPRPAIPDFPQVDGRDAEPVREFLDPIKDLPDGGEDPQMRREDAALLAATAASQLTKDAVSRTDALAVMGRALRISADKAGYTEGLWPRKVTGETRQQAEGEGEGEAPSQGGEEAADDGGKEEAADDAAAVDAEGAEAREQGAADDAKAAELLVPAREALQGALEEALAACNYRAAGEAAFALCACIGESAPARAAELLNVYQSCKAQAELSKVLLAALPPDSTERVLLRKLDHLASGGATPDRSPHARKAHEFLTGASVAVRRLTVHVGMSAVRESLEAGVCLVTLALEQGHEGTVVWAAWLVGGAPPEGEEEDRAAGPQVARFPLDGALFQRVLADAALLRSKQKRKHVDMGYLDDGLPTRLLALRLLDNTQELLKAPMHAIAAHLRRYEGLESLVLICDRGLSALPLESCPPLSTLFSSVSRDFSLAMHMHRRESAAAVDKGALRFIVDPRNEDVEASSVGTVKRPSTFATTCAAFGEDMEGSFAGGVMGSDHIPSRAELQRNLSSASLFLYQGPGPLLCHMSPALVSTLNLAACQCVVLLDRAENEVSERRQNKVDTTTLASILQLRDAWATAALLSLRGVNAVLLNQWSMDAACNHAAGVAVVSNGLLGGEPLGKAHGAAGVQLLATWQRLVSEVEQCQVEVAGLHEQRKLALDDAAQSKAKAEEERAAAEARGEEVDEAAGEGDEAEVEWPSEEDIEAAQAKMQALIEERDSTDAAMRGVEGALALALYGVGSLSC